MFNQHINAVCSVLIFFGMLLFLLPNDRIERDYQSFSDWVKNQVDSEFDHSDLRKFATLEGIDSSQLEKLHQLIVEKGNSGLLAEKKKDSAPGHDLIRLLYLAWTQVYGSPDMAAAFLNDRLSTQSWLKGTFQYFHHYFSGILPTLKPQFIHSEIQPDAGFTFLSYMLSPAISGMSLRAP